MSRQPFIAGNWKMYKTGPEAVQTAIHLAKLCSGLNAPEIMIAPTHLSLPLVAQAVKGSAIKVGAQNLYFEQEGAFTGEVSAGMLKAAGAEYSLIGHSERRQLFGETDAVSDGLKGFGLGELSELVLAYEPVWAIGTGKTASIEQVAEVHQHLRSLLERLFSKDLADRTRILYGGSVKPENVKELMGIKDVDGALVGGASLDADKFIKIIKYNK
jgi:triosephosphate isomerase